MIQNFRLGLSRFVLDVFPVAPYDALTEDNGYYFSKRGLNAKAKTCPEKLKTLNLNEGYLHVSHTHKV